MVARKIRDKGRKLAAHLLEASPGDLKFKNGEYRVVGPDVAGRGRSDWLAVKADFTSTSSAKVLASTMASMPANEFMNPCR